MKKYLYLVGSSIILLGDFILLGCQSYNGELKPDGYHSSKTVCYKNKGCIEQDCIAHYISEGTNRTDKTK